MRITDLPSIGIHSRSHDIRRDVAAVLSSIGIAKSRGVDVSDHVARFKQFIGACAKELKAIQAVEPTSLTGKAAPVQTELSLEDI